MPPNEFFWKDEQKIGHVSSKHFFAGVGTEFWLLLVEKSFENTLQTVCSTVQNLRLGSITLLQKIIASQETNTELRTIIVHLTRLLCFVNPSLQSCYKENIRRLSMHLACLLWFVNPSLQSCYKESV